MDLFDSQIERLLNGDTVKIPTYNFILGRKEYIDKINEIIKKIPDGNKEKEELKKEIKILEENII